MVSFMYIHRSEVALEETSEKPCYQDDLDLCCNLQYMAKGMEAASSIFYKAS